MTISTSPMCCVSVSGLLYSQTRRLARLASKCDGRPVESSGEEDADDDDTEGRP
jgi:hypothetical protein